MGDVVAYTAASVPQHKIFIINKDSVVHVCSVHQTYRNLSHMVDITFPPLATPTTTAKLMEFHESRRQLAKATAIANAERRRHGDKTEDAMSPLLIRTNTSPVGTTQFQAPQHADPTDGRRSSSPDSNASDEEDASATVTTRDRASSGLDATHAGTAGGGIEQDAEAYYNEHEAAVAEMQAEEDFNSFNFWRVTPSAMVEPRRPVVAAPQVAAPPAAVPPAPSSADPQETGRSWAFWRRQHSTTPKK
jgi:phosphatidate phosphatase LPIN